jgi:type I restriction enzyme S subunit
LGKVCKTGSGGTPLSSRKEYYEGGNIPWLLSGEVAQGNVRVATKNITKEGLQNSAAKIFPRNTVLVAMYGATAGQVGILRFEAATNQAICGILPNERFIPEFLFYFLLSKKDELVAQATGNAQPNISQIKIKNTEVPVPPLPEQQRIVGILDEAFEGLATAKANAEKNLQNARAIFESHLQSVFSQRGPGWVEKPFEGCIEDVKYTAKIQRKEFLGEGEFPIVSQEAEFTNGYWDSAADVFKVTRPIVVFGDHTQVLKYIDFDFVLGADGVKLLSPKSFLNPKFFFYALRSAPLKSLGYARHYRLLKELQIGYPDANTQVAIAKKLDALVEETQHLTRLYERKIAALEELKQSLLHQAFTGQL